MKYIDEYRSLPIVQKLVQAIHSLTTKPWTLMEVCGGQTHTIMRCGIHDLLPKKIRLIHGPGCPVCVTPLNLIDHALQIASKPNTILCSFGDMLRVPGSQESLLTKKAKGADIRFVTSPLDALHLAQSNPSKEVVFFAIGFETTAPMTALIAEQARLLHLKNLSLLVAHVLVPPALHFLLQQPDNEVEGFLAAGHVCTISGFQEYELLSSTYRVPIVVTAFEPVDILQGIYLTIQQLETKQHRVLNQYDRSVQKEGNTPARHLMNQVFRIVDRQWRGMGLIPSSGLDLRDEYAPFNAALRFPFQQSETVPSQSSCISGLILQGKKRPSDCPHFGSSCRPETPLGAPMVSSEGACAAYYRYGTHSDSSRYS